MQSEVIESIPEQQSRPRQRKQKRARQLDTSEILTTEEVAARLRMERNEVYKLIRSRQLASIQQVPGGKHRIPAWALERFTKGDANGTPR